MLPYLILGSGYAFAAGIQPGPLQAFLLSRVTSVGWRRTLPASLAPLVSDGPIALLGLLFVAQLPPLASSVLQAAGGLLLVYLGFRAYRQWRDPEPLVQADTTPRTILQAALVNLLNPNPYLAWALVLGPAVKAAMAEQTAYAVALLLAFYVTLILTLAGFILAAGTARYLDSRAQQVLQGISALLLAGLGVYLTVSAVGALLVA